jgi:hypothetical protein
MEVSKMSRATLLRAEIVEVTLLFNGDIKDKEDRAKLEKKKKRNVDQLSKATKDLKKATSKKQIATLKRKIAKLEANGKTLKMEKDNVLIAEFDYPRSGESKVLVTEFMDIPSHLTPAEPKYKAGRDSFFDFGFFKQEVQGETVLQIGVSDKDKANKFAQFLKKVLGSILKTVGGAAIKGLSGVVTASTASTTLGQLVKTVTGDGKDKVEIVAKSKKLKIGIDSATKFRILGPAHRDVSLNGKTLTLALRVPKDLTVGYKRKIRNQPRQPILLKKGEPNGSLKLKIWAEQI